MWIFLIIYFAINLIITAITFLLNYPYNLPQTKWSKALHISALVLFGTPIVVFGLIYCYIIGRKELRNFPKTK